MWSYNTASALQWVVFVIFYRVSWAVFYLKKLWFIFWNQEPMYWDFSLEWFLCEECLTGKFYPNRFLNVLRFYIVGFYCCHFNNAIVNSSFEYWIHLPYSWIDWQGQYSNSQFIFAISWNDQWVQNSYINLFISVMTWGL